jgi:hypothetical protein
MPGRRRSPFGSEGKSRRGGLAVVAWDGITTVDAAWAVRAEGTEAEDSQIEAVGEAGAAVEDGSRTSVTGY